MLDGFGSFIAPPSTARPVPADFSGSATAEHPPGFYGPPESLLAVNTLAAGDRLSPLDFSPLAHAGREIYRTSEPQDLRGPILLAHLRCYCSTRWWCFTSAADWSGSSRGFARRGRGGDLRSAARAGPAARPRAKSGQHRRAAVGARNQARLCRYRRRRRRRDQQGRPCRAYALSRAAHRARSRANPIGLDIAHDELAFYPLIYWPIVPGAPRPSDEALKRIDTYMKDGGTVLFDTRDAVVAPPAPAAKPAVPACSNCAKSCPRSTSPNSSRCRAITC